MPYKKPFFKSALSYEGKILANYKHQINVHNKLLTTIQSTLPDRLANHALYCVISEQKVILYTDSAVWSSQLRFYHQTILHALLSSNRGSFNALQIKVIPKTIEHETKDTKIIPSNDNINLILAQAESQSDEKLKSALLKLGQALKHKAKSQTPSSQG